MKPYLFLSFLLLAQIVFGQTEKHMHVPGTKCSLIPPAGFIPATTFGGFQHDETGASIMVSELPAPYQPIVDGFTAEALAARGMTLLSKQTVNVSGSRATMIQVTQQANGTTYIKQMLIFGDSTSAVLINGIYPETSREMEVQIKDALLSTIYHISPHVHPLDVTFAIDISDTDFKFTKYLSGSLLYSTEGKIPTESPTIIVSPSFANVDIQTQRQFAVERLRKLPGGEHSVIKDIKEITIDNLKGYEIVAEGKTNADQPKLLYQVMLFTVNGVYYVIVGQSKEKLPQYLETFKKLARTFKRR